MLAYVAAALFGIAFILHAAEVSTEPIFGPTSLMLLGLAVLAAHLGGALSHSRSRR